MDISFNVGVYFLFKGFPFSISAFFSSIFARFSMVELTAGIQLALELKV